MRKIRLSCGFGEKDAGNKYDFLVVLWKKMRNKYAFLLVYHAAGFLFWRVRKDGKVEKMRKNTCFLWFLVAALVSKEFVTAKCCAGHSSFFILLSSQYVSTFTHMVFIARIGGCM